jgi:hypothetical protein
MPDFQSKNNNHLLTCKILGLDEARLCQF